MSTTMQIISRRLMGLKGTRYSESEERGQLQPRDSSENCVRLIYRGPLPGASKLID